MRVLLTTLYLHSYIENHLREEPLCSVRAHPTTKWSALSLAARSLLSVKSVPHMLELSGLSYWRPCSHPLPAIFPIPFPAHTRLAEAPDNNQTTSSLQAQCVRGTRSMKAELGVKGMLSSLLSIRKVKERRIVA